MMRQDPARPLGRIAAAALVAAAVAGCGYDGPTIEVDELKAALDDPGREVHVIHVRPGSLYRAGHVPGAVNIPRGRIRARIDEIAALDGLVVAMCTCGRNALATCKELKQSGIELTLLVGGMKEWKEAGHPVETGPGLRSF